ncbi:hypothetical protein CGMCC3_g13840 [Colletotrichum fructicola]|nr:uncharacterized protein CGMCC3_g13840 [Colletotrichum fructicola]KAE9570077.1 hypothetical protein CGMCC3_g13840 [Colletotrichum fructicola]
MQFFQIASILAVMASSVSAAVTVGSACEGAGYDSLPTAEAAPTPVSSLMSAPLTASAKRTRLHKSTERMKMRCCVDGSRSERCRCSLR